MQAYNQNKHFSKIGLFFVLGLLVLITLFFFASEVENREQHFGTLDQISTIKQYDILLSEDILKLQSGLLIDYDSIVDSIQKIESTFDEIEHADIHATEDHWFAVTAHPSFRKLLLQEQDIQEKLNIYKVEFKKREKDIERFKAINATLRNSQKSFPIILDELVTELKERPNSAQAILDVELLLYDESLFLIKDDPELRQKITEDIRAVRNITKQYPDLQELVETVTRHAEIIAGQEDELHRLVANVTDPVFLKYLNNIHDSYNTYFGVLHNIGYSYRVMMFTVSLLLLVTVLFIGYRLFSTNTLLQERTANIELLQRAALAANEAKDLESAIHEILMLVCQYTGWSVGHAYYYNEEHDNLLPSCVWYLERPADFQLFKKITERTIFERGKGLPGRVLANKEPAWIPDVQIDDNFPRNKEAKDIGVHAGLAFPIMVDNNIVAILEFFATEILEPENDLLERVAVIGTQIGLVIERKMAQERLEVLVEERTGELQSSEARLKSVLDTVLDGIITINAKGTVQSMNPAAEQIFGYQTQQVIGQNVKMLMPHGYAKDHDQYIKNYLETGKAQVIGIGREVEAMRRDGSTFPMELGISEVSVSGERMFVGIIRDISERKQTEQDLIEAKEKAEEATRLKSEFLANMSHEIRTPMNGVIGMTNLLMETDLDATQTSYTKTAMNSAENLLELINDILDFSKIEAGKLDFEIIPFDLQLLVEEVADLIAVKAHEKNLEVLLRFAPDMPRYVMGDPGRVRQIFLNLTSNALKFTESGHILIDVDFKEMENGKIEFCASVEDTGIGIPKDKQDYIFNKFDQADSSTTRKFGGTGLGLAICKELAHMMDGKIGLNSTPDIGSTFWFTAQLAPDKNEELVKLDFSADLSGIKAIIIEDNETAQYIVAEQMRKHKMDVTITSSGEKALKIMQEAVTKGEPYQMAVVDYMMPGMDGMEIAREINNDDTLSNIRLLMVSSAPNRGDSVRLQSLGFDGYLIKPVSGHDIIKALCAIQSMREGKCESYFITRHILREAEQKKDKTALENLNFKNVQILLVEDNPTNQMVATTMLENYGCNVTAADNGKEAVSLIKQRRFDLVFMDCQMPEMDGFEATQIIRRLEDHKTTVKIPIVAFTAHAMKGDDQKCFDAGMDDYMTKPINKNVMAEMLLKWLPEDKCLQTEGSEDQDNEEESSSEKVSAADGIDYEILNQMKDLMGQKFTSMIERYLEDSAKYIAQTEEALANGDAKLLTGSTHPLKSSSASLGVIKVAELAADLEHKADEIDKNGGDVITLQPILEELKKSFIKIERPLRQEIDTTKAA